MSHRTHDDKIGVQPEYLGPPIQQALRFNPELLTAQQIAFPDGDVAEPESTILELSNYGTRTFAVDVDDDTEPDVRRSAAQ